MYTHTPTDVSTARKESNFYLSPLEILELVPVGQSLLVITDKDGTLDNAHQTETIHAPPAHTVEALMAVQSAPSRLNEVAIISGRELPTLRALVGAGDDIWYIGSHGTEVLRPRGETFRPKIPEGFLEKLALYEQLLRERATADYGDQVQFERRSFTLNVWWQSSFQFRQEMNQHIESALREAGLEGNSTVLVGAHGREVLPPGSGKGPAVNLLLEEVRPSFVLCAGNDIPDIDMFETLSNSGVPHLNVIIGSDIRFEGAVHLESPNEWTDVFYGIAHRSQ